MTRYAALAFALLAILEPPAYGAGGPIAGADAGPAGVTVRGTPYRFVALPAGERTLIARIERRSGKVSASRTLPGRLVVSAVAFDGAATGLSGDGWTLVLASPRLEARRSTTFTVLETRRLKRLGTIELRGDFTLDAISPDGKLLYLIETRGARYAVRAYDMEAQRLLPDPVVDPEEADEPMRGVPMARASSPDGRWAYTLYDAEEPFIHALDTERAAAKCIDLDQFAGRNDMPAMSLKVGPSGTIAVRHIEHDEPLLVIDPVSFAVSEPRQAAPAPARAPEEDGGSGWPILAGGLALIALVAFVRHRRVRDNVQTYVATRLERDVVRTDVGAAGGDGEGRPGPARPARR